MPGGDKTGPEGRGPMTGRSRGICSGDQESFTQGNYFGRGRYFRDRGRAFHQGLRGRTGFGQLQSFDPDDKDSIISEIESLKKYLSELESKIRGK